MSPSSVLIVEDEAIVAADLANRLQQLGYVLVGSAATGESAIDLARRERPTIVLMDIRLAGAVDGITAADTIRRELDLPVVFLTAYSDVSTLERAKTVEPFGYLCKPFEERELRSTIEMAVSRHRAEQQVRQQREWLRVTLRSIGDAVITCDTEGRITFLNPVAETVTGWRFDEAAGLPISHVLCLINELTRQPCEDLAAAVLRGGLPRALADHTVLVGKNGREVPIEDSAAPILDATGKVVGVVLVFHDVTEKRRAKDALEVAHRRTLNILESITDGYFSLDREYRVTHINERGAQLIGKPPHVLLNRSLWESFPEAVGSAFQKAYERALRERIPTSVESFYPPLKKWFEARAFPSPDGLSVFYQDITSRRRVEDTRKFLLKEGAQPKGDFFKALARHLAEVLRMDYVCIDLLHAGSLEARTVAVYADGQFETNVSYALKDTPCGEVVARKICCFPRNVRHLFPGDAVLQSLQAESYVGTTLWSTAGQPIGLIAIIGRQPLVDPPSAESILQLVSGRAGAELERRQLDLAKEEHLARLNLLVDKSRELLDATSTVQLLRRVLDTAGKLTGATLGVCGRVSGAGQFHIEAITQYCKRWALSPGRTAAIGRHGLPRQLIQGQDTVRYSEAQLRAAPHLIGFPAKPPVRGLLGARLVDLQAQTCGLLILSDKSTGDFTAEDEALLGQLAALCSASMQQLAATERAEERADQLAKVFGAMTDGVMILDADGVIVAANRAVVEGYGFNPVNQRPELIRRKLRLRYAEGRRLFARPLPSQRALSGEVVRGERIVLRTREGRERTMVTSAAPLRTRGKTTGAVVVWHDVTEREWLLQSVAKARDELEARVLERTADLQRALALLQATEERYRTLFREAPLGIAVTTRSGRVLDANPTLCELLGCSFEEARAMPASKFYAHPADRGRLLDQLEREGLVREFETLLQRRNGSIFPAQVQATKLTLGGQRVLLTMVQDLSRRKHAEKRIHGISSVLELFATKTSRGEYLEAAVRLLRTWCDCSGVGVRLLDEQGCLPYAASQGFDRRFREQEHAVRLAGAGCPCIGVLHGLGVKTGSGGNFSARNYFCNQVTEFLKRKHGRRSTAGTMPCVEAGFESIGHVPIRFHGQFLGSLHLADRMPNRFTAEIIGFIESVASFMGEALHRFQLEESLVESEERFRSLFEKHDAMMLLLCPTSGALIDANPAAARFYGCTREMLCTLNVRDLGIAPPMVPLAPQPLISSTAWKRFETPTKLGSAEARTVEVFSSHISVQRRPMVFAIMHDITERKLLERQIIDIGEKERQRIGRDLHDSLGGHLTGGALLSKALAQTMTDNRLPGAPMAREIVVVINQALDMTRGISHGLCPVQPGAQGLIDGLHEFVVGIRQRSGVSCRFRVQSDISVADDVVASHLYRIVEEAVQNALRHAKPARIDICLQGTREGLSLTIWNDGRRLPARFNPEHGLGLRTMRFRANLIGGELAIRRSPRGGTVVSCHIPNDPRTQAAVPAPASNSAVVGRSARPSARKSSAGP